MREKKGLPGQRIGDVLRESGAVTDGQLKAALEYQKRHSGLRLGNVLMELGYISEKQMLAALGIRLGLKLEEISRLSVELEAVEKLPAKAALRHQILPVRVKDGVLTVLTNDPLNFYGLEDVRQITGMDLEVRLC